MAASRTAAGPTIGIDDALRLVIENLPPRRKEQVGFEAALGCVLAEDIAGDSDIPPFHRSAMDGYAVRAEDLVRPPATLTLAGEIRAGGGEPGRIRPGEAKGIMTGAPVPEGADAVQIAEESLPGADGRTVVFLEAVSPGDNIRPRGSDSAAGQVVLEAGRYVGPAEIAVMATFGYTTAPVWRKPRVALVSTGDELVEAGEQPRSDQIRNLNAYSMSAQLRYMGIPFRYLGIVQDRQEDIRRVIEQGLQQDVLIMTGGVSVGEYDFVRDVFRDLGLEILFSKVAIRPGKPTVFARKDDRLVFGLPGNPVSTFVTFEIFVRAALGRLSGLDHPDLPRIRGFLQKDMHQSGGRTSFLPAWVTYENDRWEIAPLTWQGSGDIIGFARGNATVVFPGDRERMSQGEIAEALLLPDYWSRSRAFPQEGGRP